MSTARLKTELWAAALIRRAEIHGAFGAVLYRGDRDGGAGLVIVSQSRERARLFVPALDAEGARYFMELSAGALGEDPRAIEAYCARRRASDPDLWVIEIQDRDGRHFLTEPVR